MGVEGLDEVAAVIDKHTGKVRFQVKGFGAVADAQAFLRQTQSPTSGNKKVDFLSSGAVITGKKAEKAIRDGRI